MKLEPARRIRGHLRLPGDKSISHRAALIAAIADGTSDISNFSTSRDCASTLSCLQQLGVEISRGDSDASFVIQGREDLVPPGSALDCGNSGSTIRMLAGVLAGQNFESEVTGDASLRSRPMRRIMEPLELMGARIESQENKPPLKIRGSSSLSAITYKLPMASAQVKSCILFAALRAPGPTLVIETSPSRDHSERLFTAFGVPVHTQPSESGSTVVEIHGPARFSARAIEIPGDVSSAAYFVAAATLLGDSDLTIESLGLNPTRAEYLYLLRSWGADLATTDTEMQCNEPVGTVRVRSGVGSTLRNDSRRIDPSTIPLLIDELPLLAVVGSQLQGGLEIGGAKELRVKETDRLTATIENLRAMGAQVEEHEDGLSVSGPTKLHGALIHSYDDHRIAMAFAVAALIAEGPSEIIGSECVAISFPEFFQLLETIAER